LTADIVTLIDQFGHEILLILLGLLFITSVIFMWLWFINRRTYHNFKHHIPASVVKTYLDSVIQNSLTLKTSLFRGGGAEIDASALGAIGSPSISGDGGDAHLREQLAQRSSELARLQAELNSARGIQRDLEQKLGSVGSGGATAPAVDVKPLHDRIKDLEAQLAAALAAGAGAGGDAQVKAELSRMTKERDELKEKLREYEIIEDDLANLKRLQQENAQLKKALEAMGGKVPEGVADLPPAPAASKPQASAPQSPAEQATASMEAFLQASDETAEKLSQDDLDKLMAQNTPDNTPVEAPEPTPAAAAAAPSDKAEKTPEDLLSEFEKMLG
jgi:hypothetical protein